MLTHTARIAVWVFLALASTSILLLVAAGGLFLSAPDLPNLQAMKAFAPEAPTPIADAYICGEKTKVVALPTSHMTDVRDALLAAEGDIDSRTMLRRLYDHFLDHAEERKHYGYYSLQLSRQLFCDDHRSVLKRQLSELRASVQLERQFTADQLLDLYLNRANFGAGSYGIESAAEHYFAKPAAQLSTSDAALLVGLLRNPKGFSPIAHPDRALARRNEVIDAMVERGSLSSEQAEQAKGMPLGTATAP